MSKQARSGPELLPVFLKLDGRPVLVVGGGPVALGKAESLVRAGAHVTVVAPVIGPAIAALPVTRRRRPFRATDLDGQWFVISAANPTVNRAVAAAAARRRLFVNAADDRSAATAYLGGVIRRAGVTVAISTDGEAPALAGLLREGLDALLPVGLGLWLRRARALKRRWRRNRVPMPDRRPELLKALIALYPATSRRQAARHQRRAA